MSASVYTTMPICAINPCSRSVTLMVRLMRVMSVRAYGRRTLWKVIFMDYQCDEIFGSMEGDVDISRWRALLITGKVYHISGLSVDAATDGEKNVVTNNYKLVFSPRTRLLGVIDDCPDIPFQHRPPFLPFVDVPQCLRTPHNVVDVIGIVVAISPLERTRDRNTARRELLLSDMQMHPLRLTLWGDFADVEGSYIEQHLTEENILLASRVHIRNYQGISVSTLPVSRLLINPDIEVIEDFEGWYSGTKGVMKYFDLMRTRTLRMHNLEKLFAAKRIRLDQHAAAPNVRYFRIFAYIVEIHPLLYDACTNCNNTTYNYVFALNVPYCTCQPPRLTHNSFA